MFLIFNLSVITKVLISDGNGINHADFQTARASVQA